MFVNQGIQPVTVVFTNTKDCFIHLPSKLISHLSLNEKHAVELSWDHGCPPVFLGWTRNPSSSGEDDHKVALCRHLGQKLGLKDGEQGYLRPCHQVSSVHQVFVEPVSSDDWEILELHSSALEQQLLDQIRVVFQDAVFPVWVDQRTVIYIRIASLTPSVPYGRLEQFTELMVSPKIRAGTSGIHHHTTTTTGPPLPTAQGSQKPPPPPHHRHRSNLDLPSSAAPLATSFQTSAHQGHGSSSNTSISASSSWGGGGIADLKSLVRYMLTGSYDDRAADHPVSVPTIPALVSDSMYRVCRAPPGYACTISPHGGGAAAGVVHLFPWWRGTEDGTPGGRSAVTYGLLSRVLSPKEGRERVKRSAERKKKVAGTGSASSSKDPTGAAPGAGRVGEEQQRQEEVEEEEETMVVRVVCHHMEQLAGGLQRYPDMGEIHCGRVWMPEHLTTQLNISPHSMVRIKPVQTTCKVASCIRLQPLKPESQPDESDEDIQTAFLDWLHAQSHQPLACLTARHSVIPLHGHEAKLELALTVLKPEPENDHPDQLFLLSPTLLRKPVIQVDRQPVNTPAAVKSQGDKLHPDLPCTSALGGVKDLIITGFEFIYYSLQAGPLSRELVSTGRGLRGGALLITGAKGSGKSSLAKALCRRAGEDLDAHVEVVDCKKLKGKRVETVRQRLEEVFEQAVWRQPSVVLLDDLDHVTGAPTSPEHEHGPEAILRKHIAQSLIDIVGELVQRSSLVCLLLSSHSEHSLHASLTQVQGSHFIQGFLHIQPPDQTQRAEILRCLMLRRTGLSEETSHTLDLGIVAKETEGYAPRDLALLLERSVHASVVRTGHTEHGVCVSQEDFHAALKGFTAPSLLAMDLHTPPSGVGLDRVGGLKEVRRQLMDAILLPAKYPILFSKLPIRHCSGLLLYGAPGTGKTLLAGAVAKESGMNFISIKGPELLSKYIGASEQAVRDVFQRAQAARPCILFFDEFDSLAPRRGHDSTGVTDRVVNQLLTQLDGVEGLQGVYVLAASSRPDLIDPALLRPGRLDKSLYCPPPDLEDRVEILKALSSGLPLADDVDLEQLASATELFTGADLRALLYNGQLEAAHCSLAASTNTHELASGSDSDMSLGSMIFLNHSSGSDDSAGEAEPVAGPDQAAVAAMAVLPENQQRPPLEAELHRSNLWRLYFGSSYESELGNNNTSLSGQNSQCVSGPNSMSQDLAGLSVRLPPAYMPSVQRGFEEPNQEQMERLLQEIRTIKSNLRRANGRQDSGQQETPVSSGSGLLLTQSHLTSALQTTRASLSKADWNKYRRLYEAFGATGESTVQTSVPFQAGQRVTLA